MWRCQLSPIFPSTGDAQTFTNAGTYSAALVNESAPQDPRSTFSDVISALDEVPSSSRRPAAVNELRVTMISYHRVTCKLCSVRLLFWINWMKWAKLLNGSENGGSTSIDKIQLLVRQGEKRVMKNSVWWKDKYNVPVETKILHQLTDITSILHHSIKKYPLPYDRELAMSLRIL